MSGWLNAEFVMGWRDKHGDAGPGCLHRKVERFLLLSRNAGKVQSAKSSPVVRLQELWSRRADLPCHEARSLRCSKQLLVLPGLQDGNRGKVCRTLATSQA